MAGIPARLKKAAGTRTKKSGRLTTCLKYGMKRKDDEYPQNRRAYERPMRR